MVAYWLWTGQKLRSYFTDFEQSKTWLFCYNFVITAKLLVLIFDITRF